MRWVLEAHLPKLIAEDEIRQRAINSELTGQRLYDLVLQSTGEEKTAEKVQADFLIEEQKKKWERQQQQENSPAR